MESMIYQALIFLLSAVVAVPLTMRMGLGSVFGYLIAGVMASPFLALVGADIQEVQHFAEFGIVMLLFIIGLDIEPRTLWETRYHLVGLGAAQIAVTTLVFSGLAMAFGQPWTTALLIGLILSLSSTALVTQTLTEACVRHTRWGRSATSILVLQNIAVVPMLAVMPLFSLPTLVDRVPQGSHRQSMADHADGHGDEHYGAAVSLVEGLPGWGVTLVTLCVVAAIVLIGSPFLRWLFRYVRRSGLR